VEREKNALAYGYTWPQTPDEAPVLVNAASMAWRSVHSNPRARHANAYWVLDYSLSDMGLFKVGSLSARWRPHPAGEAILYPPRLPYWEDMRRARAPVRNVWLMFRGGRAAGLDRFVRRSAGCARFVDPEGRLGRLMEQAAEAGQRRGDEGFWEAMGVFYGALALLQQSRPAGADTFRIPAPELAAGCPSLAAAVNAFLRQHLAERLSLADLAAHAHVSVSTLSHRYRVETGETPKTMQMHLRVQQARNLLMKGLGLKQIAAELGFSDVYHLSKMFKRKQGQSPRQFRNRMARRVAPRRSAGAPGIRAGKENIR